MKNSYINSNYLDVLRNLARLDLDQIGFSTFLFYSIINTNKKKRYRLRYYKRRRVAK